MHEKKRHLYSRRVLDIEHGSFTPFSGLYKTDGKGVSEELIAIKIGEHCEKPMSCHSHYYDLHSFVLEALEAKRTIQRDIKNPDIEIEIDRVQNEVLFFLTRLFFHYQKQRNFKILF